MGDGEVMILLFSGVFTLFAWGAWYGSLVTVRTLARQTTPELPFLLVAPPLAGIVLFWVLRTWASFDVRDSGTYLFFYMVLGAAWVGLAGACIPYLGISPRDDVVERHNHAAAYAVAGALVALAFCYAGGNIGDGPGWWVVIESALLSTLSLFAVWLVFEELTAISDSITVDRDVASGVRLAGFLVACSLILGRAVAGDWESRTATLFDFFMTAWPVVPLAIAAVLVERNTRPNLHNPAPAAFRYGLVPAFGYLFFAALLVRSFGIPS